MRTRRKKSGLRPGDPSPEKQTATENRGFDSIRYGNAIRAGSDIGRPAYRAHRPTHHPSLAWRKEKCY